MFIADEQSNPPRFTIPFENKYLRAKLLNVLSFVVDESFIILREK
jgi:hypothetical protein